MPSLVVLSVVMFFTWVVLALRGDISFQADRPLAALHQPRPFGPLWRERAGAGSALAETNVLRTLRIYGYASAFWPFQPCYAEKIEN